MSNGNVSIGRKTDLFEDLQILNQKEAEKIARTLEIKQGKKLNFRFSTCDFPELICEVVFGKNEEDKIGFKLDLNKQHYKSQLPLGFIQFGGVYTAESLR